MADLAVLCWNSNSINGQSNFLFIFLRYILIFCEANGLSLGFWGHFLSLGRVSEWLNVFLMEIKNDILSKNGFFFQMADPSHIQPCTEYPDIFFLR